MTATLGLSAAFRALGQEQPDKVPQSAAAYQSTPNGLFTCALCTFFIRPHGCRLVSGTISATGWCRFFDMPD